MPDNITDLNDVIQGRLTGKGISNKQDSIDEVEKTAQRIKVIDETVGTADKLAGGPGLREEIKKKEDELDTLRKDNQNLLEQLHKADINTITSALNSKIDQLTQSINKGESKQKISEQLEDFKNTATALGLGTTKMSELNQMLEFIDKLRPNKALPEQIKEAKELVKNLEPPDKEDTISGLPASVALQVKKMEQDLQITLQNMEDARQERAQKFELTLLEFKDNRELKKAEIEAKIAVEKERNELLGNILTRVGTAFAKGSIDAGVGMGVESGTTTGKIASQFIEANEGEFGEVTCPSPGCGQQIAIARDATQAICAGCGTAYPIRRIKKEPEIIEPET
jgi:ribosomal protein S27E